MRVFFNLAKIKNAILNYNNTHVLEYITIAQLLNTRITFRARTHNSFTTQLNPVLWYIFAAVSVPYTTDNLLHANMACCVEKVPTCHNQEDLPCSRASPLPYQLELAAIHMIHIYRGVGSIVTVFLPGYSHRVGLMEGCSLVAV